MKFGIKKLINPLRGEQPFSVPEGVSAPDALADFEPLAAVLAHSGVTVEGYKQAAKTEPQQRSIPELRPETLIGIIRADKRISALGGRVHRPGPRPRPRQAT